MAIIIERTITIKNDQATLDNPLYLYVGDGDITFVFTIKEMKKTARFGTVSNTNIISDNDAIDYGEVRIYKPDERCVLTSRGEIVDDRLQALFSFDHINDPTEAGIHKLQIHLYDNASGERNRLTIPPVDLHVLLPVGYDNSLIDEAIVDYSLLDAQAEEIPTFDENGNYNKTIWTNGDIITKDKLNKLEDALHQVTAADDNFVDEETFNTALNGKANVAHTHTEYATKKELNNKAAVNHTHNNYAPSNHVHNGYAPSTHAHNEYATREELSNKSDKGHGHDNYALKKDINIPTRLGQLTNDKGYITSAEIPSNYVTESELSNYKFATENYVNGTFASQDYVKAAINNAKLPQVDGSSLDLSAYALKSDVPTRTSQLTNNSGFLTDDTLNKKGYATTTYVNDTIDSRLGDFDFTSDKYATKEEVSNALATKANNYHEHVQYSLTDHNHNEEYDNRYMLKGEIPEINIPTKLGDLENDLGYVTEETVNGAIENINNNLTNNYALKKDIPTVPTNVSAFTNDAGYAKETTVDEAISNINQNLTNNYVTKANMPTKVSQLENDKGYITKDNNYITSNGITRIEIVDSLPETEELGVLYIVKE